MSDDTKELSPLTDKEKETFTFLLREAARFILLGPVLTKSGEKTGIAITRTTLDEKEVAIVVDLQEADEGDGDTIMTPLAVLIDDDIFARLEKP